jgi:serine/threonine-protein kinase
MPETLLRLNSALSDRYRIERELGAGGMATVYLAHDLRHDRPVALKLLRPELSAILGGERFLAEIKTTANLQHPHILSLYDSGEADGLVFYVMPYVDGESLRDRLTHEKQLPVDEAVRIAREVADALDYAHRKGVVHRDIKPENILLHDGRALVADFGIALAVSRSDGGTRMTETGMSLGTPHYMSPEQAMGEREITPRADVYALGCVLYEMLTGEPPYTGPTAQAIIARVMTEEPRSLTLQRRTIPPHVETAVQVALAKLPADRFASAQQFADALAGATAGIPVARAASAVTRSPVRRSAVILPWAAVVLVGAAGAWGWLRPGAPPPTVSRQRIVVWDQPVGAGTVGLTLTLSPDGRTIVYGDTVGGTRQLWAKDRDRLEPTAISGTTGARAPAYSPDGQWIAFVAEGKLKKVPRLGGSAVTIADSAQTDLASVAWLENDTILYADGRYWLMAVGANGGAPRVVIRGDSISRGIVSIAGLPGGRAALIGTCTFGCPERDLRVLDLRTGALRVLVEDGVAAWSIPGGRVVFVRRDGGVFVAPFALDTLGFAAPPTPVLNGVRVGLVHADMALAPAGTLLYVAGAASASTPTEAVWVTRAGLVTQMDPGWGFIPAANGGIALSPDGTRLAIALRSSGSDDIWVKQLDRGPLTRLTFTGTNERPVWSADGRTVYYIASAERRNADVFARLADGTGREEPVFGLDRPVWEVLAPGPPADTTRILVRLGAPPSRDLYTALRRGDTTGTALLADQSHDEVSPTLSPDGRWLAYASNESGRYEVYVRPYPDVGSGRWQVSRSGGAEPLWARSGRELFFRAGDGMFVAADVRSGASFTLGELRPLFSASGFLSNSTHRAYAVAPDGNRFVFARFTGQEAAGPANVVLVEHWFTELDTPRRR